MPTEELLKERADGIPEEDRHEDLPKDLQFEMKAYLTIPAVPEQVSEVRSQTVVLFDKAVQMDGTFLIYSYFPSLSSIGRYRLYNILLKDVNNKYRLQVTYLDATTEEVAERVKGYNSEGQEWLKKNK